MKSIILDYETKDPHLTTWGSGWATNTAFSVGCGIMDINTKEKKWLDDNDSICEEADKSDVIICHNAPYDCGFLTMYGVDLSKKTLIDTKLLASMNYNLDVDRKSGGIGTSLAALSKKYLKTYKTQELLGKAVQDHHLYTTETGKRMNVNLERCTEWAYKNMDIVYKYAPKVVSTYCLQDLECTYGLYEKFKYTLEGNNWEHVLSNVVKQFILMKKGGLYVDLNIIKQTRIDLMEKELEYIDSMSRLAKMTLNEKMLSTGKETKVPLILSKFGIPIPRTEPSKKFPHGQLSVTSPWLEVQEHEFCKILVDYRRYRTYRNNYCDTVLEYADLYPNEIKNNVLKMHPDYNILAAATGRSTCAKPNVQQVPGEDKDKEFGYKIRSAIINPNGKIAEYDYKQQEFRLFADLIAKVGMPRIADEYKKNPDTDFHEVVARIIYPDATDEEIKKTHRPTGKKINFGKLYGKGVVSTCAELGVPEDEGKRIIEFYDQQFPEVKKVNEALKFRAITKGHITIDGRKLYVQPPIKVNGKTREFYYRLLNYYCQGRGANQIYFAMSMMYDEGITPYFEIHDSLGLAIKSLEEDKEKILKFKYIMEHCIDSTVDMLVDIGIGNNWAEAKSKEGKVNV